MSNRSVEMKLNTKLRLLISQMAHRMIMSEEFGQKFRESSKWHPKMTMIPCEGSRPVGEVRQDAERYFARGEDSVLVPVLVTLPGDKLTISFTSISQSQSGSFWSENIASMDPDVTMEDLVKTLSPNKRWDMTSLQNDRSLAMLADLS